MRVRPATGAAVGRRPRTAAVVVTAAALVLVGCGGGDDAPPEETGDPVIDEPAPDDADDADDGDADDTGDADSQEDGADPRDEGDDSAEADDEVAPLAGEPGLEASAEAEGHGLTVTDVRVSGHEGFDRIVFELDGEEAVGYDLRYEEDGQARAQGSGREIDLAGDEALAIALHGIALPPDADEDTDAWEGDRLEGPSSGVVLEFVEDTIYEGVHTFHAGTDAQHPFVVGRLEDPQRLVIDVHHSGE